ncbi:MAG: hypothetical protein D6714_10270, partial [Bacteroidetes bacterium]
METNGKTMTWQESPAGKQMMATFSQEKTLLALEKLLQKVDTLEKAVGDLSKAMAQGPGLVAMVGDMVDEEVRQADARGVNVDERLRNTL